MSPACSTEVTGSHPIRLVPSPIRRPWAHSSEFDAGSQQETHEYEIVRGYTAIELTAEEVVAAIETFVSQHGYVLALPRTVRVNGDLVDEASVTLGTDGSEHPDGCYNVNPGEVQDCRGDGHYVCRDCTRWRMEAYGGTPIRRPT